jgi:hypothetical protein
MYVRTLEGLGQSLTTSDVRKAVRENRGHARSLGWGRHRQRIVRLLGLTGTPNDAAFARAVARWQQRRQAEWKLKTVDGIIGPNTWRVMACYLGLGPRPQVNTSLPQSGPGFYSYKPTEQQFGLQETVQALSAIAAAWKQRHLQGPRIGIGDISCQGGGSMVPRHKSHQKGIDVDIRPARGDGREEPVSYRAKVRGAWRMNPAYSRDLTQELVKLIRANCILQVDRIFFNDPKVKGVKYYRNHDDHLHIRFYPPGAGPAARVLRRGALGPAVCELQRRLNVWRARAGKPRLDVDGIFAGSTKAAVQEFQAAMGLKEDGEVGRDTRAQLPPP